MPNKEKADINDLIQVINNPQHETDISLPGQDSGQSESAEQKEEENQS